MTTEIDRKIAVIFVADVVGYSKHMEKNENATIKSYTACEKILNKLLKKYKGSVFNTAGDSVLAEFPSAVNAVECGVDFQNEIKKRNHSDNTAIKLEFRLGINMGDVVKKDGNLIGDGVNIAARLEALAQPNGVTISKSVYDFVVPKTKMTFNDLGIQKVKQNEFHAFDILLDPSQKRSLKTTANLSLPILGGVAAFVILAFFIIFLNSNVIDSRPSENEKDIKRADILGRTLLIMPFENNSSGEFDYVGKGITDHLRSTLPSTILMNIVPRQKSQQLKSEQVSLEKLKESFDVSYVLSGRVSVVAEKFRLSLELLDIHKGEILFASNSEFVLKDLFSAQDDIEFLLRKEIQTKLTMGSILASELDSSFRDRMIYKQVLNLRVEENKVQPSKTFQEIENAYQKIFELNPDKSIAAYLYARSIFYKLNSGESKNREVDAIKIFDILNAAIKKDQDNSTLYAFRAFTNSVFRNFYVNNLSVIENLDEPTRKKNKKNIVKALALGPDNHDTLYWSSKFYTAIGNSKLAAPLIEKAISLAPFGPDERKAFRCRVYLGALEFEKAEEVARQLVDLADKRSVFLGSMFLAFIEAKTNRVEQARLTFQKILNDEEITKKQAIAQFRQYFSGGDAYYSWEFYNVLESLKANK